MGYQTDFVGSFQFNRPLTVPESNAIKTFSDERHEGPDFPGYYCQWIPTDDGMGLEWDGNEKFYDYVEWLEYLITNILPKDLILNGTVRYQGEEIGDVGRIEVKDNVVKLVELEVTGVVECPECGERFVPGE